MGLYLYRLMGAATFDASMYEGLEADRSVTWQAALTVVLSSVGTGIGLSAHYQLRPAIIPVLSAVALLTWAAWGMLMFQIGSRVLREPATRTNLGELLRTTGFAAGPGALQALAVFPEAAVTVFALTTVWMIAATVIAIKHALDYASTWRAISVCLLAVFLCAAVAISLSLVLTRPTY